MSIGIILFLYNLFLCDIDSIYTMFFFNITCKFILTTSQNKQTIALSCLIESCCCGCFIYAFKSIFNVFLELLPFVKKYI